MNLEMVFNYKDNDILRQSFDQLARKTFGISFEKWYQKGLWRDSYVCYSYKDIDKIVANVSVTKMILNRAGQEKKVLQIGTVMTDKDYRGRGLARNLLEHVLDKYKDYKAFYLFANQNVLDFYPKFGFKKVDRLEYFTKEKLAREPFYKFRRLDMDQEEDLKILIDVAENRLPVSDKFFLKNSQEILYWYCLGLFRNMIYYNKEDEFILIYEINGDTLNLYDIITKKKISYKKVLQSIFQDGVNEIVFHFNIESDEFKIETRLYDGDAEDDPMFVNGDLDMTEVAYPITAHT